MSIEVNAPEAYRSADRIESAADQLGKVDVADALAAVSKAMPDSPCVAAAATLQKAMDGDIDAWVRDAHEHSSASRKAVDTLVEQDRAIGGRGRQQEQRLEPQALRAGGAQ